MGFCHSPLYCIWPPSPLALCVSAGPTDGDAPGDPFVGSLMGEDLPAVDRHSKHFLSVIFKGGHNVLKHTCVDAPLRPSQERSGEA